MPVLCGNCGELHPRALDVRSCYSNRNSELAQTAARGRSEAQPVDRIENADHRSPNPTPPERLFEEAFQKLGSPYDLLADFPLFGYVVDFYCQPASLAIEIDGGTLANRQVRDQLRDEVFAAERVTTLRVPAEDVFDDPDAAAKRVLAKIDNAGQLQEPSHSSTSMKLFANRYAPIRDAEPRKGGMSLLYPCTDLNSGVRVAVKVLVPNRDTDHLEETIFDREMNVKHLRHDNIVRLYDSGRLADTGQFFLVFEWVDADLKTWVDARRPLGADDFVEQIALPLLSGLAYAHEEGVVHRDVKPSNVLMTSAGVPQLTDFGISKVKHRLVESGPTVVDFVSRPFAPPEGHHTSTYSRDVFSMGVLMLWCLAEIPVEDYSDFADALDTVDASPQLQDLIESCISLVEDERPRTAIEVFARLEEMQSERRTNWVATSPLHLGLTNAARRSLAKNAGIAEQDVERWLKSDMGEPPAARRLENVQSKRSESEQHFFIYGSSSRLRVSLDPVTPVGTVIAAHLLDEAECDSVRDRNFIAENYEILFSNPIGAAKALRGIERFLNEIEQHEAAAEEAFAEREERRLLDQWKLQMDAREAFDRRSAKTLAFSAASLNGFRLSVELDRVPEGDLQDQRRRVVNDKKQFLGAGVIESVVGPTVSLYLDNEPRRAISRGHLLPETTASAIKLRRERAALESVRHQTSMLVRRELPDILLHPGDAAVATRIEMTSSWVQDLDGPKKDAVSAALGSPDFLVVEGPPGTGKTSFIAELIAQTVRAKPTARILIASQTNVALDNALERVRELGEDMSLLRIGNPVTTKIADSVVELTADEQLKRWRSRIEKQSEKYLERLVTRMGAPLESVRAAIALKRLASLALVQADLEGQSASRVAQIERSATPGEAAEEALTDDEIEEVQDEIARIADRRKQIRAESRAISEDKEVARHLKEVDAADAAGLLSLADSMLAPEDRAKIAPLIEVHSEWIERLGRGDEFYEALLYSTQVTAATCIGFARFPGAENARFDLCIVDEASKATATETLVPLVHAERWVLVGDDKQLPPFQDEALRSRDLIDEFGLDEGELHRSLFTRMYEGLPEENRLRLSIQYRMVNAIGDLISSCFYDGSVENAGVASPAWTLGLQPEAVTWYDTHHLADRSERRRKGESSVSNPREVERVRDHLKRIDFLLSNQRLDVDQITVLVLAPYAAQVQALTRAIAKVEFKCEVLHVEVNTVDAAQGREADVLIFSATRSNSDGNIGFVRDFARSNVALSRGRFLLAIFGDGPFFDSAAGPLTDVLQHIRTEPTRCAVEELHR